MADCKLSPQEFISNAFTPQIAIKCTSNAQKYCQKNNLDFTELLQPFSRLSNDVYYKDPSGFAVCIRSLKLTFLDIDWTPPQTAIAKKLLNISVSEASESRIQTFHIDKYKLDIPTSTPWFEAWRDAFLKVQYPSDHEFTKHFLSCMLVVSSMDDNPIEAFAQLVQSLNQVQSTIPGKLPKWFNANILKYYIILHDKIEGNEAIANNALESIKALYGVQHCFLLKINSRAYNSANSEHLPDPWSQFINNNIDLKESRYHPENNASKLMHLEIGQEVKENRVTSNYHPLAPLGDDSMIGDNFSVEDKLSNVVVKEKSHGLCLSTDDVEQIKLLVYEFTRNCLLPYIEKQILMLNDVVSNKKGMSKSLFSATKRWFSPNKPGTSLASVNNLIYAPDSPELQVRRLGDLYFMFGHYTAAFQAYHLAKRDYNTDQAWLYFAGALEMASLAAFMGNESSRKTCDYMDESITTYSNTCKMPQFATRATLLSSECLKYQKLYGEAALQFIRMTSEESDLRSALFLEQASYCFLQSKMIRKYAFHMVLAGHRFSKAAQKKHSLRCYKQAYQIYNDVGWYLASDHIHYTIGRQANNLQNFDEAEEAFSKLLKGESKQSAQQQATFLKEYMAILTDKLKSETNYLGIPVLPVPELDIYSLKVLLGTTRPISIPGKISALGINPKCTEDPSLESKWIKLEEMLIQEAEGSLPIIFKPITSLYTVNNLEKRKPIAIVNERIQIFFKLINTLQTVLHLKDLYLLWNFTSSSNEVISSEHLGDTVDTYIKTYKESITLDGNSSQDLVLGLTPLQTGTITITGFCYTLIGSSGASESNFVKGKQLIEIPESCNRLNSRDLSDIPISNLQIDVVPPAPCLQVTFSEINLNFLSDELQRITVDFHNTSSVPLKNIFMATSVPHLLCNCEVKQQLDDFVNSIEITPLMKEKLVRKNHVTYMPLPGNMLEPGQTSTFYIWVKAPNGKGPSEIDLLIYYENVRNTTPRYRLVRHKWQLSVQESIAVNISTQASHNSKYVEELALAIKITNLNKLHSSVLTDITLLNVGLLSKNWMLTKDLVTHQYINLLSQESAHILLKAKRNLKAISEYSSIPLNTDKKCIQSLTNTYLAFAKKAEKPSITMFDDIDNFQFKEFPDGILLVQWQAVVSDENKKRVVHGQCHVPIEINRNEQDVIQMERIISDTIIGISDDILIEQNSQIAQKQVSYNLTHPPIIQHNFEKEKICVVPIKLLLHSINESKELSVAVNTTENNGTRLTMNNKSNLYHSYGSSDFSWIGSGKVLRVLKPLMSDIVNLAVVLSGPGTFDLGAHIQVFCKSLSNSDTYVLQLCQIHSALIVANTNL